MRCLTLLALGWLSCGLAVRAQTNAVSRSLSLHDCIALALEHNLSIQIDRYSPEIARYMLRGSRGIYDPAFTLSGNQLVVNVPAQFDAKKVGIGTAYRLELTSFGPGLLGRLPWGLTYGLSSILTYQGARSVFPTNVFDPNAQIFLSVVAGERRSNAWFQVTGVTLTQPLLRDFWIDAYRRDIQLNKKTVQISELALKGSLMTILTQVETAYYDLLLAREQTKVRTKALEVASQFLQEVRKQVQVGTLTALDANQAESSVETARSLLAGAEGAYARQKNVVKNLITDKLADWISIDIEASDQLFARPERLSLQESWSNALVKRPDLLIVRLNLEKEDIDLRYVYNQLFPRLDLFGTYGWYSFNHSFSGNLDDQRHGANAYYSAGVILSFPLENIAARNSYKGEKVSREQAAIAGKKVEQAVITQVETAVKNSEVSFTQVISTEKARQYADAALDAQLREFRAGNTNSFVVLQYQGYATAAQSAEIVSIADYNKAKAQLSLSEGTTLERYKISVKVH